LVLLGGQFASFSLDKNKRHNCLMHSSKLTTDWTLLGEDDHPPFTIINEFGRSPILITCDHASNRIPSKLGNLGLEPHHLLEHIAWDIGCARVCKRMSELLDAPLILAGYSRLVIDLNRHLDDVSLIPAVSDRIDVPGNKRLTDTEVSNRIEELFLPYHDALSSLIELHRQSHEKILICSMHSFTPNFQGFERPWHIGILWNNDYRVAEELIGQLEKDASICVGKNQPYHAAEPLGYGMDVHAEQNGLLHALIELRQDLLLKDADIEQWAEKLTEVFANATSVDDITIPGHR